MLFCSQVYQSNDNVEVGEVEVSAKLKQKAALDRSNNDDKGGDILDSDLDNKEADRDEANPINVDVDVCLENCNDPCNCCIYL